MFCAVNGSFQKSVYNVHGGLIGYAAVDITTCATHLYEHEQGVLWALKQKYRFRRNDTPLIVQ
jgi:hypothetical protein